ncbi:MAG: response regulator transcription factor [Actinomycetota bacterium]|nr:response regulator transcription factor [Actinomycetota bacterium]
MLPVMVTLLAWEPFGTALARCWVEMRVRHWHRGLPPSVATFIAVGFGPYEPTRRPPRRAMVATLATTRTRAHARKLNQTMRPTVSMTPWRFWPMIAATVNKKRVRPRVVAAGESLLAPKVTARLTGAFCKQPPLPAAPPRELEQLNARERDVLTLLAQGLSNGEIAERLAVSLGTVRTHVAHILMKLHLRDRVQAVVLAYETASSRPVTPSRADCGHQEVAARIDIIRPTRRVGTGEHER